MNPIQSAIQNGWKSVLESLQRLNPIPEPLRPLFGSRVFWFAVWVAAFSAFGRNLLGERFGGWAGVVVGGLLWWSFVPDSSLELGLLVAVIVVIPVLGTLLRGTNLGRRARGLKVCPDCAEEVKGAAKVCKHCSYRFEGK
ncbi:MAG: zinc ribbon domain-containing protein [Pleurocapsa sp. SU_196_0]|nr:zinc ribbon domain-containing protein [Pleurocapsa sp. SU_196_0]